MLCNSVTSRLCFVWSRKKGSFYAANNNPERFWRRHTFERPDDSAVQKDGAALKVGNDGCLSSSRCSANAIKVR